MSAILPADSESPPSRRRARQSFAQRLESSRALMGYSDEDEARVRATREVLSRSADQIAAAVYEYLLSHPETAAPFMRPDGRRDSAHISEREQSLKRWLAWTLEAPLDDQAADYLAGVGLAHTTRGRAGASSRIKGRYLLATMSYVQTALVDLLGAAIEDRTELLRTIAAWNKLLMIQLDLFLAVYASSEGSPKWY